MGYAFFGATDLDEPILEMSSRRAMLFVSMTEAAAQLYDMRASVIEFQGAFYIISEEPFCALTKEVFFAPLDLLSVWAVYASGIYEHIQKEKFQWLWGAGTHQNLLSAAKPSDLIEITPVLCSAGQKEFRGVIGPKWYEP